jgi:hypothetical protein
VALFTLSAAQAAEKGTVKIVTEPGEAQITVNGERKGTSPADVGQTFAIKLDQGDYTIEASKNGKSEKKQVFVASDTLQTVTFKLGKMISGRYLDNGDGTVTDTKTNLMWKKCSEGQIGDNCSGEASKYKWDDAMSRVGSGVSFAGHSDWRMPTKEELKGLVYCSNGTSTPLPDNKRCSEDGKGYQRSTIDSQTFPNTPTDFYWSSTAKDASFAWSVFFYDGNGLWNSRVNALAVRLVRSGQ